MKKLSIFLLAVIMAIVCSGSFWFWNSSPKDPVLEPADIQLPEGHITPLGNDFLWIYNLGEAPIIANLQDGSTTPVTVVNTRDDISALQLERSIYTLVPYLYTTGGRYSFLNANGMFGLLDRETATITQLALEEWPDAMNPDGTMLFCQEDGDAFTLILQQHDGTVLQHVTHTFEGYRPSTFYPLEDGYLVLLSGESDADWNVQRAYVKLDRNLNAGSIIPLGSIYLSHFSPNACYDAHDGIILLQNNSIGLLVLSETDGPIALITWSENDITVTRITDPTTLPTLLADTTYASYFSVVGFSANGQYALLDGMMLSRGLFKLDLSTLTITEQMTHDELTAIGLKPLSYLEWDGGDYLVTIDSVYRIVER